jgi:CRISPR-associated Csx11 family protein
MTDFEHPGRLQEHRPLLLACEAIGWLHMTEKAKVDFLRSQARDKSINNSKESANQQTPQFPGQDLLNWIKEKFSLAGSNIKIAWPVNPNDFFSKYMNQHSGVLGLFQAGHAMASGIEKQSLPDETVKYLRQDTSHTWLSTAFGHPVRNLLMDPPELLTEIGWNRLLEQIEQLLIKLQQLGENSSTSSVESWWRWRNATVGLDGWLRKAFTSTLAETRLPNNDVTLFDQSYVAAALFKSAMAGAILEGKPFPWSDNQLKQKTRWRLLTIGIGADHYESRAIKIGDWTGARLMLCEFFKKVCQLVEVDLAIGSLLYADGGILVFSFPGERYKQDLKTDVFRISDWQCWLTEQIDSYARAFNFEIPPYCRISEQSSRSLVGMTAEIRKARETMAVPLHRKWEILGQESSSGHVCPVCHVRRSSSRTEKQAPCDPCRDRRVHRLDNWLDGEFGSDTIWISEVADAKDRLALVTMSLDLEPWLDGTRLDALRTQAISEWRAFNPHLRVPNSHQEVKPNPIDPLNSFDSLCNHINEKLNESNSSDLVLNSLQNGFIHEKDWPLFFSKIVEDRTNDALPWDALDPSERAAWLTHQLFRKLPSPGRIYRFERQGEEFFMSLLDQFRGIAAADQNRWRARRLVIKPDQSSSGLWEDRQIYGGRGGNTAVSLLYRQETNDFLSICNLSRLLQAEQGENFLQGMTLELKADESLEARPLVVQSTEEPPSALGVYHPVIPLELSPVRFRVLLPLEAASGCVDRAVEAWREQFARVWDRLPLRIGVVAFPRMTPFQAVIEAARNLESDLDRIKKPEAWRVAKCETHDGITSLSLKSIDGRQEHCQTIPITLPGEREDVFYPYLAVDNQQVHFPLDFRHPDGRVFRHVKNLKSGDGVYVSPSQIATLFLDSTSRRFESISPRNLTEWERMRDLWMQIAESAPSQSALRSAWSDIVERRAAWQGPDAAWLEGGMVAWLDYARMVFHDRLGVRGGFLETLVNAISDGLLEWSLEWHVSVLKKQVSGGDR